MFQKGKKNAIELLSLKSVVHKHMVCSGHATDVESSSLGRKKIQASLMTHMRVLHY